MSILGLALLSAAATGGSALAKRRERVEAGELEPIIHEDTKRRARQRARAALQERGLIDEPVPVKLGDDPNLDDLYWRTCDAIGYDPGGARSFTLAQYVMDLVDIALFEDSDDEDEDDPEDWTIAGRRERRSQRQAAKSARQAQRQSARSGRQAARQSRRGARPARRAGRQAARGDRQAQRQAARAERGEYRQARKAERQERRQDNLDRAARLARAALLPHTLLTDPLMDRLAHRDELREAAQAQELDNAWSGAGQVFDEGAGGYDEGGYGDAPGDYAPQDAPPPPTPAPEGAPPPQTFEDEDDFEDEDTFGDEFDDEPYDLDEEDFFDEDEEGDLDEEDFLDAEELADSDEEDFFDAEIEGDPAVSFKAASAAVKLVSSLVAARRASIERGEEPVITNEDIKAAKARAVRRIAVARRARREQATIEGDTARRRHRGRPAEGHRPAGDRGAVLWGDRPPRVRPSTSAVGVSLMDVGVDPSQGVQIALKPTTLAEAAELLLTITRINVGQLQDGARPISEGIDTGEIVYGRPDMTTFATIRDIWRSGVADCAPLSAAYAAERTVAGHPSVPYLYYAQPGVIHAVVRDLKTGDLYDPSKSAGMGSDL